MSRNYKNGFSLLETLVAISVLTVALLGVYNLVSLGVSKASFAKNQNIAFFLGQEGMEYINNKRMTNAIAGNPWLTGLNDCINPNVCSIDAVNNSIPQCPSGNCPKIKFDSNVGYNYSSGQNTVFQRKIIITLIQAYEIKLTVEMKWQDKSQLRSFIVEEQLFNWI